MGKVTWKGSTLLAPVPAVMVSCGTMEESNIITIGWTGILNSNPPKTYVSIRPERYSYEIIKKTGEFVINLATEELIRTIRHFSAQHGHSIMILRESLPDDGGNDT